MPGSNENSIAAIGGKTITNRIPQMDMVEKTMQEQKSIEAKKAEKTNDKVVATKGSSDSEKADLQSNIDRKRFYNVKFDDSLSKLFTEVIDRETENVVFRIPAGYSKEVYGEAKELNKEKTKEE